MKTHLACRKTEAEKSTDKPSTDSNCIKGLRRTLQPLQNSVSEKENLVSGGSLKQMQTNKGKVVSVSESRTGNNNKKGNFITKKIIECKKTEVSEDDLISEGEPSENYWKILAEKRREALEEALKENEKLHGRISFLEEENAQCKILLDETKSLVETLTEMLCEEPNGNEDEE